MRLSDDSSGFPDVPSRRLTAGRLSWTAVFSVTEIWATIVVITQIRVTGVDAAALALVISGVVLAIWSEWQEMRILLCRSNRSPGSTPCTCERSRNFPRVGIK